MLKPSPGRLLAAKNRQAARACLQECWSAPAFLSAAAKKKLQPEMEAAAALPATTADAAEQNCQVSGLSLNRIIV
jgi:hypothetical protein